MRWESAAEKGHLIGDWRSVIGSCSKPLPSLSFSSPCLRASVVNCVFSVHQRFPASMSRKSHGFRIGIGEGWKGIQMHMRDQRAQPGEIIVRPEQRQLGAQQ